MSLKLTKMIQNEVAPMGVIALLLVSAFVTQSCTDANFAGGGAKALPVKRPPPKCKKPPCDSVPNLEDVNFSGDKKIEPIQNTKIWTATTNGVIKRFTIDGDKVTDTRIWKGGAQGTGGMRTYVTEGGFLGARFPNLYFIDPDVPGVIKSKNIGSNSQTCVASYMKDGQRYMIAAWGEGNYVEYPMDDKPPYAPKWDGAPSNKGQIKMGGNWGYSCFIDQTQKIFYSQFSHMAGIDLKTYTAANINATAPNAVFRSQTAGVSQYSAGATKKSYAMSGDPYGNVYNGAGYTSAYEKSSDSVWFSNHINSTIVVIDRKCLTTQNTCTNFTSYTPGVTIGPMSPLKDGRVVGAVRGSGDIYLMNLKDKSNLKSGLDVVKIGNADGVPYMYTDFTGATLYINESEQSFKPVDMPKFVPSKPIKTAVFKWVPTPASLAGNTSLEWKNIKLEARCYSNAQSKPAYEEVSTVQPSNLGTALNVSTCKEGKYQFVDVKLTQLNNASTLVGIDTISVGFTQ